MVMDSMSLNQHPIEESAFFSKAFPHLMKPSQIIPYYYRASGNFDKEDITITSLITSNRFETLARLVQQYKGPISVTFHINNATENVHALLNSLHQLYTSTEYMSTYVDVHLVLDTFDRRFNTWRNIARLFARTDYVMMLDVDFYLCTDFRDAIRKSRKAMELLKAGLTAFVVPAFEYSNYEEGRKYQAFPRTKKHVMQLVQQRRLAMFHEGWVPGHNSTDYSRYYSAQPGEVYRVERFHSAYEPYTIFKKDGPPWCDERFVGYGGNKAACHFEMYLAGVSYYVLTDHFIIHQNHVYEENTRKNERKSNRKLYAEFKEETCLRYLRNFHELGILNTTRASNALDECGKIRSVSRIITQLLHANKMITH